MTRITLDPPPSDPRTVQEILDQLTTVGNALNQINAENVSSVNQDVLGLWAGVRKLTSAPSLATDGSPTQLPVLTIPITALPVACTGLVAVSLSCGSYGVNKMLGVDIRLDGAVVADSGMVGPGNLGVSTWYLGAQAFVAKKIALTAAAHTLTFYARRSTTPSGSFYPANGASFVLIFAS